MALANLPTSSRNEPSRVDDERGLVAVARAAIVARVTGEDAWLHRLLHDTVPVPTRPVFVTLLTHAHTLRGCIGHLTPHEQDLAHEVAACAASSATEDPRFAPVSTREIGDLTIEISLLSDEELTVSEDTLDPMRYGVTVRSGRRCGVLLPNVDGVVSAHQQVDIALKKAGIHRGEPFTLCRFTVEKIKETNVDTMAS
jgi:AmmeMemoRadiSam system protein A